jgi:hypothetical protein
VSADQQLEIAIGKRLQFAQLLDDSGRNTQEFVPSEITHALSRVLFLLSGFKCSTLLALRRSPSKWIQRYLLHQKTFPIYPIYVEKTKNSVPTPACPESKPIEQLSTTEMIKSIGRPYIINISTTCTLVASNDRIICSNFKSVIPEDLQK